MNSVFCCFHAKKNQQNAPETGLVNQFWANLQGQLDWTGHMCKQSRTIVLRKGYETALTQHNFLWVTKAKDMMIPVRFRQ